MQQPFDEVFFDIEDIDAELSGVVVNEVASEWFDIGQAFAKWWDDEAECIEAVVEVRAEAALFDERLQLEVTGSDDSGFDFESAVGADGFEFALFDNAEEFDLLVGGEDIDFVEEDGTVSGGEEFAVLICMGTGEGTFDVAEEFAFDEFTGECTAGNVQERF
ncbi:MAG: hypothetical protein RLZZ458_1905 [Planctomycetota bacterium]